jgi:quercetin dioxygenase-like cupin family protein
MRGVLERVRNGFGCGDQQRYSAGSHAEESPMPLPQDIRPAFQDIQDTLVRSEAPWIEQTPRSRVKVLWVGRETGTWASLHHWKQGYAAPPHKHLAGAHVYILSGKLQVRTGTLNAGDYVYEPSGVLHDATTALEDTTYLFICNGPILFFDENGFTRYTNWEVMERLRIQGAAPQAQAAE